MVKAAESNCLLCALGVSVGPAVVEKPNALVHKQFHRPMALHMHVKTCNLETCRNLSENACTTVSFGH